jgi:hypothetical protein
MICCFHTHKPAYFTWCLYGESNFWFFASLSVSFDAKKEN